MEDIIRVSIRREDPLGRQESFLRKYDVETERDMTVLEILQEIYSQLDPTLAYRRYRCGRRLCRSCEVKLDGKIVRGCATLLHPGKAYLIEAARPGSIIRDLVFDFDTHSEET